MPKKKKVEDAKELETAEDIAEAHAPVNDEVDFIKDQNAALTHYRLTGHNLGYVDPIRAQEPDVAPEPDVLPGLGVFNPPPPLESQRGFISKPASDDPRTATMDEKEKLADESDGTVSVATGLADSAVPTAPVDDSGERKQDAVTGEDVKDSDKKS